MRRRNPFSPPGPSEDDDDEKEALEALADSNYRDEEENTMTAELPFGTPGGGVPRTSWSSTPDPVKPYGFGSPFATTVPPPAGAGWAGSSSTPRPPYGGTGAVGYYGYSTPYTKGEQLNRRKKIIFCDLLNILIESMSQPGYDLRGSYDIRLKFDVLNKLKCFTPDYIFILTNLEVRSKAEEEYYRKITDYVSLAITEYMHIPSGRCQVFVGSGYDYTRNDFVKPNTGLMERALSTIPGGWEESYSTGDLLVIGSMSGERGQSDRDAQMASSFGVDYMSVETLINSY